MSFNAKDFTPFSIELSNRKFKVSWIRLGSYVPDKPFFADSISHFQSLEKNALVHITDEAPLLEVYNEADYVKPTAFIFHVSRCGSTLVSNALRCIGNTIVIPEAQPVSALLVPYAAKFLPPSMANGKQARESMLRSLVMNYGLKRDRKIEHLFIKFSSWNIKMIGTVKQLWPQTPILFIYRQPLEVLHSLLLKHPQWIQLCAHPDLYRPILKMTRSTIDKLTVAEYFTRMLKDFYTIGAQQGNDVLLLHYEAINPNSLRQFLSRLSINITPAEMELLTASLNQYSKSDGPGKLFKPTAQPQTSSAEALSLSKKYLEKYYTLLNDRFAEQALFHATGAV